MRSGTRGTAVAAGLVATMALSGCLKMDVSLTVATDDTVSGTMILAFDKALGAATGKSEDELRAEIAKDAPTAAPGTRVERYADGTYIGSKITLTGMPLADFNKQSDAKDSLRITHDPKARTYTFSGALDLSSVNTNDPVAAAFARTLDIRISIALPGTVVRHNGQLTGNTVTWTGKAGAKLTMEAVSAQGSDMTWLPIVSIGIPTVLVIVGVIVWLVMWRRSGRRSEVEQGPEPHGQPWPADH